jgi:hypothetical protein
VLGMSEGGSQVLWSWTPSQGWVWDITGTGRLLMGLKVPPLKVVGCLGEVAQVALMVTACWECTMGAQVVHLLDPLAEQDCSVSGLWGSLPVP